MSTRFGDPLEYVDEVLRLSSDQEVNSWGAASRTSSGGERCGSRSAHTQGYPHDLNSSSEQHEVMTGGRFDQIDHPTHVVA
jgi:hypothetical protein